MGLWGLVKNRIICFSHKNRTKDTNKKQFLKNCTYHHILFLKLATPQLLSSTTTKTILYLQILGSLKDNPMAWHNMWQGGQNGTHLIPNWRFHTGWDRYNISSITRECNHVNVTFYDITRISNHHSAKVHPRWYHLQPQLQYIPVCFSTTSDCPGRNNKQVSLQVDWCMVQSKLGASGEKLDSIWRMFATNFSCLELNMEILKKERRNYIPPFGACSVHGNWHHVWPLLVAHVSTWHQIHHTSPIAPQSPVWYWWWLTQLHPVTTPLLQCAAWFCRKSWYLLWTDALASAAAPAYSSPMNDLWAPWAHSEPPKAVPPCPQHLRSDHGSHVAKWALHLESAHPELVPCSGHVQVHHPQTLECEATAIPSAGIGPCAKSHQEKTPLSVMQQDLLIEKLHVLAWVWQCLAWVYVNRHLLARERERERDHELYCKLYIN